MKLMVLDGNSIVNRAFYAIRILTNKDGLPTNGVYGFLNILFKLIDEEKPDALCITFDLKAPTFRHLEYEAYKAHRKGMPDELAAQIPVLKEVLGAMNIPQYAIEGYEADDLIGSISRICDNSGWECVIVTGDRDSLQLITPLVHVKLVTTRSGKTESKQYTPESFFEEYGFEPYKLIDLKGLMGDSSDNIPGVAGIGEKTAMDLVLKFGTIDEIYNNIESDDIKEAVKRKLRDGHDMALISKRLATIVVNVPFDFIPKDNLIIEPKKKELYDLFKMLDFNKLIEKLNLKEIMIDKNVPEIKIRKTIKANTYEQLEELKKQCEAADNVVFICTKNLDGIAVCINDSITIVLRNQHEDKIYMSFLHEFFGYKIKKVSHDIKSLMTVLLSEGIEVSNIIFDTSLGAYILDPSKGNYTIERIASDYLVLELNPLSSYEKDNAFTPLDLEGTDTACEVIAQHCAAIADLYDILSLEIKRLDMTELYYDIELPLCEVLAHMEHDGFAVDKKKLVEFGEMLSKRLAILQKRIYELAGEEFNINSTKILGSILFDKLKLPVIKKTKTGYSTDSDVLEKLKDQHEIINEIIEFRQLSKLKSTYADGLIKVIGSDGRIHTSFNMMATATGRLSSTEPNLQNIPIRLELGSEIRKMFIADRDGYVLIDADYSQIELRLLAHISNDNVMKNAFKNDEDIHSVTASQVFGVSLNDVTSVMRSRAKAVNFGIVYGISEFSLAEDIGVSRYEAKQYIENYLEKYSGVRTYMKDIVERAKNDGYVSTLFNRRRYLPELKSSNYNIRSFGERVALNMPIQGTAADIIKLAMLHVFERLKKEKLKSRLILQVHDELIVESPINESEYVAELLTQEMENVIALSIPLEAKASIGENWYAAK